MISGKLNHILDDGQIVIIRCRCGSRWIGVVGVGGGVAAAVVAVWRRSQLGGSAAAAHFVVACAPAPDSSTNRLIFSDSLTMCLLLFPPHWHTFCPLFNAASCFTMNTLTNSLAKSGLLLGLLQCGKTRLFE